MPRLQPLNITLFVCTVADFVTMADANGFTTVTNNKKKRRNRGKKAAGTAQPPATQAKAATPAQQTEMPGVSSHMVPYMKVAAPHGFSLEEVKAMNDKMFADGSDVWNDPKAVLAELLKQRVRVLTISLLVSRFQASQVVFDCTGYVKPLLTVCLGAHLLPVGERLRKPPSAESRSGSSR